MVYKIPIVPARYQIPVDVGELVCNTTTSVKNIIELDCLTVDTSARVFAFPDSNSILLVSKNRRTHVSQLVCVANKINISLKEMRLVAASIAHLVPVSFTINTSEITA